MRDRRGSLAAVLAVLAAGGVMAADTFAPAATSLPEPEVAVSSGEPVGGSYVCGVGEAIDGAELSVVAARPVAGGARPSEVDVARFHEGAATVETEPSMIFPGAAFTTTFVDDEQPLTGTSVIWRDAPVAAWREWRIEGSQDAVSYTHLRAHETDSYLVCRLLLEKKKK